MLKALLLSLMNLALAVMAMAQINLVPNGSFEDTVFCSTPTQCRLLKALHWYNPNTATPDLFDCDLERECGAAMDYPYWNGFMLSQDGDRHSGAYFWYGEGNSNTREYQMTKLSEVLQPGRAYSVSLWYARRRSFQRAVDHIGMWFGADSLWQNTTGWLDVEPQVRLRDPNSAYLAESEYWTQLTDTFVAAGGEQWLVIGNFDPAGVVDGVVVEPNGIYPPCYYYIDSVSVAQLSGMNIVDPQPVAWWTDSGIAFRWDVPPGLVVLSLLDMRGRMIQRSTVGHSEGITRLSTLSISSGMYMLVMEAPGKRAVVKFIK